MRIGLLRRRWLGGLLIGVAVALGVLGLRQRAHLTSIELEAHDALMRLRPPRARPAERVVVVRITEDDLNRFGYPLNDGVLAAALETLAKAGPRAIGVDLYRPAPLAPGSAELEAVLTRHPRIVMIEKLPDDQGPGITPPAFLAGTPQVGFSDFVVDPGGVVRRGLLYLWDAGGEAHVSLGFRCALLYLEPEGLAPGPDPEDPSGEGLLLGRARLRPLHADDGGYVGADAHGYQLLLDYAHGARPFPHHSLGDVMSGRVEAPALRDKVVLVGTTSPSVKDAFYTPFSRSLQGRQTMYGVEVHAHAVDQLLRAALDGDSPVRTWSDPAESLWILAWSLAGGIFGLRVRSPLSLAFAGAAGAGLLGGAAFAAFLKALWIPVVPPALAGVASLGVSLALVLSQERAERSLVKELFARHVSHTVADQLWEHREQFMQEGRLRTQRMVLSVMMTDLKGYTNAAEKMDPEDLMAWVNEYMEAMATLIERHGGVVDDYWGDGIKANFGVPIARQTEAERDGDACNAVACALEMASSMQALNIRWKARGLPTGRVRIGICTGPAVVGSLGSERRLKYTSVGDTVNVAARLESFDKDAFAAQPDGLPYRILISEETLRRVGERFPVEYAGAQELKGKMEPIRIHRVIGPAGEAAGLAGPFAFDDTQRSRHT